MSKAEMLQMLERHRADRMWAQEQISDITYLRMLFSIGYQPDEANTELAWLKQQKKANAREA